MTPSESPFPCQWFGTGLENVGLGDLRPDVGTYGQYDFNRLPRLPFQLRGDFAWLEATPAHENCIGDEKAAENASGLRLLIDASAAIGLSLPHSFVKLMETRALHQRVRSNTDSLLDLCDRPVRSPIGDGHLIRFLADSQGVVFWYLYLTPDGSDHAVVASPGFYGAEEEQWQEEQPDSEEMFCTAESFEAFICRFWLENEIWFAGYEEKPMPEVGREYIERYRARKTPNTRLQRTRMRAPLSRKPLGARKG